MVSKPGSLIEHKKRNSKEHVNLNEAIFGGLNKSFLEFSAKIRPVYALAKCMTGVTFRG